MFFSIVSYGQNKHLTIGFKNIGICFGNSEKNSGLRFNFRDRNVNQINGINITGVSESKMANGLTVGLIANYDSIINGIVLNGLVGESYITNGIAVSGLGYVSYKFNGIGIGGLAIAGETLNGLFFSPIGVTYWNSEKIELINGVTVGIIYGAVAKKLNGVSIGMFENFTDTTNGVMIAALNKTEKLYGFQFGILNYAGNNRKLFRWMPIMNFNLRRKPIK